MKIKVRACPDSDKMTFTYTLEDLQMTQEEWDNATDDAKDEAIQDALNNEPVQPYWTVEKCEFE